MTFLEARQEVIKNSGKGIRRPCWQDSTLRITGDKQFAGARTVPKGMEDEAIEEMARDLRRKREEVFDGSDLFYRTDIGAGYSDGGVYNGMPLKMGFGGDGLPYGEKDFLAKDWEFYLPEGLQNVPCSLP